MRQSAAILLGLLLLVNLIGYRMIFNYAERLADNQLEIAIDQHQYNDEELITIRVPLSNPYQISQPDFERVDGEIRIGDSWYRYVKRRIVDGQLELLCIPHTQKTKIATDKSNYFANVNGIAETANTQQQHKHGDHVKNPLSEYECFDLMQTAGRCGVALARFFCTSTSPLPSIVLPMHGKPPEAV